jgi:hypothetical protein
LSQKTTGTDKMNCSQGDEPLLERGGAAAPLSAP